MIMWRMRTAGWVPKTANTHSVYVTPTGLLVQQWLNETAPMLGYSENTLPVLSLLANG